MITKLLGKKVIVFLILLALLAVILVVISFINNRQPLPEEPTITPRVTPVLTPQLPDEVNAIIPGFTGARDEEFSKTKKDEIDQRITLRESLPITEEQFSISIDYAKDRFIVTLIGAEASARAKFIQWISDNNYENIPLGEFVFTQ